MSAKPDDTQARVPEQRRSPRILARVRLHIESEGGVTCDATTAVINAAGALVLSPGPWAEGSRLRITNLDRGYADWFQVVWCGEAAGNLYKMGVEILTPGIDFWGPAYEPESSV